MNFKSKQALFDYIGTFLLDQGVRCATKNGACQYRGDDNKKCAIGAILPDKNYHIMMEGKTIRDLILRESFRNYTLPWYIKRYAKFLEEAQLIHDTADNWATKGTFRKRWVNFGLRHNLDVGKFYA
jgi:hypothetical protein